MKDLFGQEFKSKPIHLNIYADEIQSKICSVSKQYWHYIGLVVEDISSSLLDDIINERFMGNLNKNSSYFLKNNKIVHWSEIRDADRKNICKRWFEYILAPSKSKKSFYCYILGLNDTKLTGDEFDSQNIFNSKYNRFFRSAILYALKTFFPRKKIIIENIFHEIGQQENSYFFPWHCIYKLKSKEHNIVFNCNEVKFLSKDHQKDKRSNLIQLCDCILGVSTNLLHGIEKSKSSKYREELADLYAPLLTRFINEPSNKYSSYRYYRRIIIRFFPKDKSKIGDYKRLLNQFYTNRDIRYLQQRSGQMTLL
jgi:hypothetical protein